MAVSLAEGYTQLPPVPRPQVHDAALNDDARLREAAEHFESLFINMWLKSARQANEVFSQDTGLSSNEMRLRHEMLDREMSSHLARDGGGIGLADVIVRQLKGEAVIDPPRAMPMASPMSASMPLSGDSSMQARRNEPPETQRREEFADRETFIATLRPKIERAVAGLDIPPLGVLSQAALETGWGSSVIGDEQGSSHNLFGLKSGDDAPGIAIVSKEFEQGRWLSRLDRFARFDSWESGIAAYVDRLKENARYADVMNAGASVQGFADALARSGYATDPDYAEKIVDVFESILRFTKP